MRKLKVILAAALAALILAACQQPVGGGGMELQEEHGEVTAQALSTDNSSIELSRTKVKVELLANTLGAEEAVGVTLIEGATIENIGANAEVFDESNVVPIKMFEIITNEGAKGKHFKISVPYNVNEINEAMESEIGSANNITEQDFGIYRFDLLKQDWVAMSAQVNSVMQSLILDAEAAGVYCLALKPETLLGADYLKLDESQYFIIDSNYSVENSSRAFNTDPEVRKQFGNVDCSLPKIPALTTYYANLFYDQCAFHDYCYRAGSKTYGHSKLHCDNEFFVNMKNKCSSKFPLGNWIKKTIPYWVPVRRGYKIVMEKRYKTVKVWVPNPVNVVKRKACLTVAGTFYTAVLALGKGPYKEGSSSKCVDYELRGVDCTKK